MKLAIYSILAVLVLGGWFLFTRSGAKIEEDRRKWTELRNESDPDREDEVNRIGHELDAKANERSFTGILLSFLTAGLIGVIFVIHVLPAIAHRFTHAVYDSAEMVDKDPMHDARAKVAQGDWEGAIEAFRQAASVDPLNRLPWVEISKIQLDHLEDPAAAVQTLRHAIEDQEWQENDAAYLMFRLAGIYDANLNDRMSAASIMQQVMDQFPETRHSANARHKLHEWGLA